MLSALALLLVPQGVEVLDVDTAPPGWPHQAEHGSTFHDLGTLGSGRLLGGLADVTGDPPLDVSRETLWFTDGTSAGSRVLAQPDFPGSTITGSAWGSAALPNGDRVTSLRSAPVGTEPFVVEAATERVRLLADLVPAGDAQPVDFVAWGDEVWFIAKVPSGRAVFHTDGTTAGTVKEVLPVPDTSLTYWSDLVVAGAKLYLRVDEQTLLVRTGPGAPWGVLAPPSPAHTYVGYNGLLGTVGDRLVVKLDDPTHGAEPWATDGTPAGTFLLADLEPGQQTSWARPFGQSASQAFFLATTTANGREVWTSDGTIAGTFILKDIQGGTGSGLDHFPGPSFAATPSGLYFTANDGQHGAELWYSDGTTAGTAMIEDILPGVMGSEPKSLFWTGGECYFHAQSSTTWLRHLYRHTPGAPSHELVESDVGSVVGVAAIGARYLFGSEKAWNSGYVLRAADRGVSGTSFVYDPSPSLVTGPSEPEGIARVDVRGVFTATTFASGEELFELDPATGQVGAVYEVAGGGASAAPRLLGETPAGPVFVAEDFFFGRELRLAQEPMVVAPIVELAPGSAGASFSTDAAQLRELVVFGVSDPADARGVWRTDGTTAGTFSLATTAGEVPSFERGTFARYQAQLWFAQDGALQVTDGVTAAPALGQPSDPVPTDTAMGVAGGLLLFEAGTDGVGAGRVLWRTDGTPAGTQVLLDIEPGSGSPDVRGLCALGPRALFVATTAAHGTEVWTTDGTTVGTTLLVDADPGPTGEVLDLAVAGDRAFFLDRDAEQRIGLWWTDGTPAGTSLVSEGDPDAGGLVAESLFPIGHRRIAFAGLSTSGGFEPWSSDGTGAGTAQLTDLVPGPVGSSPTGLVRVGPWLFVAAHEPTLGDELFRLPFAPLGVATADRIGVDCGAVLVLSAGSPTLGTSMTLGLTELVAGTPAALLVSEAKTALPTGGGCMQYLALPTPLQVVAADGSGHAAYPLSIPAKPALAGRELLFQALAVSIPGPLFGFFEVSQALDVVLAP